MRKAIHVITYVTALFVYWALGVLVVWRSYSMSALVRGRYYQHTQAIRLAAEFSCAVTFLTLIAWLLVRPRKFQSMRSLGLGVGWRTFAILVPYVAAIVANFQFGTPLPEPALLPFIGRLNQYFFSEFLWLVYLMQVVPVMTLFSAALYCLQTRVSAGQLSMKLRPASLTE